MSGEPDFPDSGAFVAAVLALGLWPTSDYQSWPNGDGTQSFVDRQGQPVVLLWQYGKVWLCREIEEDTVSRRETYADRFAAWIAAAGGIDGVVEAEFERWLVATQSDVSPTPADLEAATNKLYSVVDEHRLIRGKLPN